jgi:hypothetical protein
VAARSPAAPRRLRLEGLAKPVLRWALARLAARRGRHRRRAGGRVWRDGRRGALRLRVDLVWQRDERPLC